jgi:hypothetical protein
MFTRFSELSKKHLLAVVFALFTGIVVVAPQLIFIVSEGENYRGLYMMNTEAETHYLARMNEFYDEGRIGNPFLFEHKYYGPQFFPSLAEMIVAFPGKVFGISVPVLNLIDKFVFPAIAFLLIYGLLFRLIENRAWSIAGGLGIILGIVFLYFGELARILRFEFVYDQFVYNRPINPQFSGILFWTYLHVLLSCYERKGWRWFALLCGLFTLSFYTYFYSFTFFMALNGVFFLLWLWRGEKELAKKIALTSLLGLAVGSCSLFRIYMATQHPDYARVADANFMVGGHAPEFSKIGIVVLTFFAGSFFFLRKKAALSLRPTHLFFLGGLFVTTVVVINQQVVTGIALQSGHYHWLFNIPMFMLTLMIIGWMWSSYLRTQSSFPKQVISALPWCFAFLFVTLALALQYSSYQHWAPIIHEKQRMMPVLSWLHEQTPKNSVVMANPEFSELIPVYTKNNVMWKGENHIVCCYLVPHERTLFTPEAVLEEPDFKKAITKYRVDYVLWDHKANPDWAIDRFDLPLLFSFDGVEIYQLPR